MTDAEKDNVMIDQIETKNEINRESAGSYKGIVDESDSGIVVVEIESNKILYANERIKDLVITSKSTNIVGKTVESVTGAKNIFLSSEDLEKLEKNQYTELHVTTTTALHLRLRMRKLRWEGKKAIVCHIVDETIEVNKMEQLQRLVDEVPAGIGIYEYSNGKIRLSYLNDGYYEMLGDVRGNRSEYEGEDFKNSVYEEDRGELNQALEELIGGKDRIGLAIRVKSAKKEYVWLNATFKAIERQQEKIMAYCIFNDISEQMERERNYEKQLEIQEGIYAENLIAKGRWNLTKNSQEIYEEVDDASLKISRDQTNKSAKAILLKSVVCKEDREKLDKTLNAKWLIAEYKKGNNRHNIEYRRRYNDETIWVSFQLQVFNVPGTKDMVLLGVSYDITEEIINRSIINELVESEYEFFGTVNVETEKTLIRIAQDELLEVVQAWGIYGKETDYTLFIKKMTEQIFLEEEVSSVYKKLRLDVIKENLETKKTCFVTFTIIKNEKKRKKKIQFCYLNDSKDIIFYYVSDITAMYEQEQEQIRRISEALEKAEQADEAKTDFLSRMSHDMRTPMNGIIGLTKLTQDLPGLSKEVRDNLNAIEESGNFLLSLINDTLDMSRIEKNKIELNYSVVNAGELINNIITTIRPLVKEKGLHMKVTPINAELEYIKIDRLRVQQIFVNIISNAVKFTPTGGHIYMEVECIKRENGIAYDRLSVEDDGIGMSEDFIPKIYEAFAQEHSGDIENRTGTGLGMPIVKNLVESMGGRIEIESKQGKGTKVTVYLNFERVYDYIPEENSIDALDMSMLKDKKILVVEDHPLNSDIAKRMLEKQGVNVELVRNGEEAINAFENSECNYYDTILMDIRMPKINGLEATEIIRGMNRADATTVPIIAMTANAYAEDVKKSKKAGMNAHLAKPIHPDQLYEAILKNMRI